jgi:hypothetical protein
VSEGVSEWRGAATSLVHSPEARVAVALDSFSHSSQLTHHSVLL